MTTRHEKEAIIQTYRREVEALKTIQEFNWQIVEQAKKELTK